MHRPLLDCELMPQPLAELPAIIFADGLVADHRRYVGKPRFKPCAALGRIEARRFGLTHPQHVGERTRGGDHLVDRVAASGADEIIGIVAFRQAGKFQALARLDQRQGQIDRAVSRAAAGGGAVEAERGRIRHPP